ncbi:hypothetical protein PPL_09937 [Heterostelium album PN500]|uniref:Uncharacterized protein n=1 Tax=Heterostelium pallidum (strain ATCC 26659 / Pp 5 / PN500) TaxID=670386 RepID=D3BPL2_HETP5|nr:hypothetical protein PPL_09937 [Heterostelium album PN500]EFA76632.1 hypothetical protein PPL_09937 [Heterostelium album PN500]|eukprot:XP_020428764.1 hypothetical protein PPL_09937 [Heterostelium album PN500]
MEEDEEANVGTGLFHFQNPYSVDDEDFTICTFYEVMHYIITMVFFIIQHMIKDKIQAEIPFSTKYHQSLSNEQVISLCNVQFNDTIDINICREFSSSNILDGIIIPENNSGGSDSNLMCNNIQLRGTNILNVIPCITLNKNEHSLKIIKSFDIEVLSKPIIKSNVVILGVIPHREKDIVDSNILVRNLFVFNITKDLEIDMKVSDNNWDFSYLGNQINYDGLISYWQILTFP